MLNGMVSNQIISHDAYEIIMNNNTVEKFQSSDFQPGLITSQHVYYTKKVEIVRVSGSQSIH